MLLGTLLEESSEECKLCAHGNALDCLLERSSRFQRHGTAVECCSHGCVPARKNKHFDTTIYFFVEVCNQQIEPMAKSLEYRKDV